MKLGETIDTIFFLILYKTTVLLLMVLSFILQTTECMVQDIWSFELLSTLQFDILLHHV